MKKTSVVIVGLLILLPKLSGQESALKLYGIRSGIIDYSYAGDMGKMLFWNGIMMYMDMKMGAFNSHQEVTSLKTDVPVDTKYFVIPKNIKFTEMPVF